MDKEDEKSLLKFGFLKRDGIYAFKKDIFDGELRVEIYVDNDGRFSHKVFDTSTNEQYILHNVSVQGGYAHKVKEEVDGLIKSIKASCFNSDVFDFKQTRGVLDYAQKTYSACPEFLWEKLPDIAVLRRSDTKKWFAVIFKLSKRKLGDKSDEVVEFIDIRANSDDAQRLIDGKRFFPGYHMNKKSWLTVVLDGKVPDREILSLIDKSYSLAKK